MNIWAILVATVAAFMVGWLWYSDSMFGKEWRKLTHVKMNTRDMGMVMGLGFVSTLLQAGVLAFVLKYTGMTTAITGAAIAALLWLGISVPMTLNRVLYEKSSWTLWAINSGYSLVSLLVMGLILSSW